MFKKSINISTSRFSTLDFYCTCNMLQDLKYGRNTAAKN